MSRRSINVNWQWKWLSEHKLIQNSGASALNYSNFTSLTIHTKTHLIISGKRYIQVGEVFFSRSKYNIYTYIYKKGKQKQKIKVRETKNYFLWIIKMYVMFRCNCSWLIVAKEFTWILIIKAVLNTLIEYLYKRVSIKVISFIKMTILFH